MSTVKLLLSSLEDEKYAKAAAAKQMHRRDLAMRMVIGFLFVIVLVVNASGSAAAALFWNDSTSASTSSSSSEYAMTLNELESIVAEKDAWVRQIRSTVAIFETDPTGQAAARELQDATRRLLHHLYGPDESDSHHRPYRVVVQLEFQSTMPDYHRGNKDGTFVIALAPTRLQPHSIHAFLEMVRHFQSGAFHRMESNYLQAFMVTKQQHTRKQQQKHLAFQEYSPDYPHSEGTVGFEGRPSGPAWYINIGDNRLNHGPGSKQQHNPLEADSCFGTVVEGYNKNSVLRMKKVKGTGFLKDVKKHVLIKGMTIQVADPKTGVYHDWVMKTK